MNYNDDEEISAPPNVSGGQMSVGKTNLKIIRKMNAPIEETNFKVLLELTGAGTSNERTGADIVAVLDVSGSMAGKKLQKMKTAILFVIKKLAPIDRLSIVTFSNSPTRLCPLRQISTRSQTDIENMVNDIVAKGSTNTTSGLQMALKVLKDRRFTNNHTSILLMSDGEQNAGGDAAQVPLGDVPVYTFGFGKNQDGKLLKGIADNSVGGTFSDVQHTDSLTKAFAQCLAGILTVVVEDLKLILTGVEESKIENVFAGSYKRSKNPKTGTITISFGNLYAYETRKILVHLLLPPGQDGVDSDILEINYKYRSFEAPPETAVVKRTKDPVDEERPEIVMEENRLRTAKMMKEARLLADEQKLNEARNKIVEATNFLEDADKDSNTLIDMLKSELEQFEKLMETQEMYDKEGRPFALSCETAHELQRYAARGDLDKLRLFATPRMDEYLQQAKLFDKDPSKAPPTVSDDIKKEQSIPWAKRMIANWLNGVRTLNKVLKISPKKSSSKKKK